MRLSTFVQVDYMERAFNFVVFEPHNIISSHSIVNFWQLSMLYK